MRAALLALSFLSLTLAACGRSPEPPAPAPATQAPPQVATAPAASSAAGPVSTPAATSAPATASAPAASSAAAAGTSEAPEEATEEGPEVAADVALAQGSVTDTAGDGSKRTLKDGDSVYPGDSFALGDDSYLDLDFTDGSHMLLRPGTSFRIDRFHFEPDAHPGADGEPAALIKPAAPESAFFSLIKGGLRAIDGIIGHTAPQSYGVETPVATIGVRGTAFDVRYCGDDCQDESDASGKPDNGLYTSVDDGSIGVKTDAGETVTPKGHSGFVKSRHERVQVLTAPPKALRHMQLPEKLKARDDKNHVQVHARQKQRRQARIERRQRRQQFEKQHPKAAAKAAAAKQKAAASKPGPKPGTPAERRQERRQQRQEQRQAQPAAKAAAKTPAAGVKPGQKQEELRQEKKQERQQQPESKAPPPQDRRGERLKQRREGRDAKAAATGKTAPAAKPQADKQDKSGKDQCKNKKDKKKGKNRDECGG